MRSAVAVESGDLLQLVGSRSASSPAFCCWHIIGDIALRETDKRYHERLACHSVTAVYELNGLALYESDFLDRAGDLAVHIDGIVGRDGSKPDLHPGHIRHTDLSNNNGDAAASAGAGAAGASDQAAMLAAPTRVAQVKAMIPRLLPAGSFATGRSEHWKPHCKVANARSSPEHVRVA